jgi:hypothetical protein
MSLKDSWLLKGELEGFLLILCCDDIANEKATAFVKAEG